MGSGTEVFFKDRRSTWLFFNSSELSFEYKTCIFKYIYDF